MSRPIYATAFRTIPGAPWPAHKTALSPTDPSDLPIRGPAFSTAREHHLAVLLPCPRSHPASTSLLKQPANRGVSKIPMPSIPTVKTRAAPKHPSPSIKKNLSSIFSTARLHSVIPSQSSLPRSTTFPIQLHVARTSTRRQTTCTINATPVQQQQLPPQASAPPTKPQPRPHSNPHAAVPRIQQYLRPNLLNSRHSIPAISHLTS